MDDVHRMGKMPGRRVVMCISNFVPAVGVGLSKTERDCPTGVKRGVSESQSTNVVPSGFLCDGGRITARTPAAA